MKNKEAKSIFSSLENYSSIPPPELWDKIEAQLDKPEKKKRVIIWWSIAASLIVGLSVPTILYFNANQGNGVELNMENNTDGVVLQKVSDSKSIGVKNENSTQNEKDILNEKANKNDKLNNNQVEISTVSGISSKIKDSTKFKNLNQIKSNGMIQTIKKESQSGVVASNQNSTSVIPKSEISIDKRSHNNNSNSNQNSIVSNQNNGISEINNSNGIAENSLSKSVLVTDKKAQISNSNSNRNSIVSNQNNAISETNKSKGIAENSISKSESVIDKSIQVNQSNANNKSIVSYQNKDVSGLNGKNEIAQNINSIDSSSQIKKEVAQLENAFVQLDKDKIKKKEVLENIDKWSVQVFAGVMSSQNYNNEKALGNTVDSKQSNGYGVKTNYKLNKKWAVSSGFKINELGQKIAGVSYYNNQTYNALGGFLPIGNNNVTNSPSNYQLVTMSKNDKYLFSSNSKIENGLEKADVTQNLKYFEMPLEISYSFLSKKKTNISMNTGGFIGKLISNDISLNGNSIGENKNVNDYVYGTLLSSTLQYEVFKKTNFFIEPGMNYYINPLENQSFNQFQWMFNVGLNISF